MKNLALAFAALAGLAACDGNPIGQPPVDGGGGGSSGVSVSELPGTTNPSAKNPITRTEAKNEGPGGVTVIGNGFAEDISYNPANDTFTVDNLAFDGANVYHRNKKVPSLGAANVYSAHSTYADDVTGAVIDQFSYRALYGVSRTGQTSFAIVRTGAYVPYGFGGFVYERNGSVTLPTSGQAQFTGAYSGLKDFDGQGGMYYVDGTMTVAIDFNDFNAAESPTGNGAGVQGYVTDRHVYDMNGSDVTDQFVTQMNTDLALTAPATALPTLVFTVEPGTLDNNGEMQGSVTSSAGGEQFETGTYYAVMSGEGAASEIAGIIVVTAPYDTSTQRDTGGFILYR
jgi:hypothetical protein